MRNISERFVRHAVDWTLIKKEEPPERLRLASWHLLGVDITVDVKNYQARNY